MPPPRVGIIVPCFNQARFAADCLASIESQTYRNWTAVLIDDASTDGSGPELDRLASERVQVVHLQANHGRALVRNEGLRLLGDVDYVLNVDCDDVLESDYVEKLVRALECDPKAGLAHGTLRYFGLVHPTGHATWPPHSYVHERRFEANVVPGGGTMFRATALRQTEGWRKEFTDCGSEDHDLWLQVVERGWSVLWLSDAFYCYRQHDESFLARTGEWRRVIAAVTILRFHHRAMRREGAVSAFLSPLVMPVLYRDIRTLRLRRASRLLRDLFRYAPREVSRLMLSYYVRRVRAR